MRLQTAMINNFLIVPIAEDWSCGIPLKFIIQKRLVSQKTKTTIKKYWVRINKFTNIYSRVYIIGWFTTSFILP